MDRDLFEALRALRLRLARERGVPPYVIFHDTTLRELAKQKPTSLDALRHVYGVGATEGGGSRRGGAAGHRAASTAGRGLSCEAG